MTETYSYLNGESKYYIPLDFFFFEYQLKHFLRIFWTISPSHPQKTKKHLYLLWQALKS